MKSPPYLDEVKNGDIVATKVDSQTTLKYFYRSNHPITLQPANPNYPPTTLDQSRMHIQGVSAYSGSLCRLNEGIDIAIPDGLTNN
ncbi:MAG: LexA family protein [Elainellaceae cyanobacterium]